MATSLFNFRVSDDLDLAIEESAKAAGVKKSMWAREVLGAVALGGVTLDDLAQLIALRGNSDQSPHPQRQLVLQGSTGRLDEAQRDCVHPVTGRKQLAFSVICSVCGATVKRT